MTRVLIVEDNENLAEGLTTTLELEGYEVLVAQDGIEGLKYAREERPDVILLDLMLPGMDGYRVLKALREDKIDIPVLILTAKGEEVDKVLGFGLGADDYVTKPFGTFELVARLRALLRRARTSSMAANDPGSERFGQVEVNAAARTVTRNGQQIALTPKAFDLLIALMRRRGIVVSRLDLLSDVWGHRGSVMTRTVDMHIAELRRKLEINPAEPRHIVTVRKTGYRFEP